MNMSATQEWCGQVLSQSLTRCIIQLSMLHSRLIGCEQAVQLLWPLRGWKCDLFYHCYFSNYYFTCVIITMESNLCTFSWHSVEQDNCQRSSLISPIISGRIKLFRRGFVSCSVDVCCLGQCFRAHCCLSIYTWMMDHHCFLVPYQEDENITSAFPWQ